MPEHRYPCLKVQYSDEKAKYAREARRSMAEVSTIIDRETRTVPAVAKVRAFGGRNLATFAYTDGTHASQVTMASESAMAAGTRGIPTRHSERACWDALRFTFERDSAYRILWVYTEREPCGEPPIGQRCNRLLAEILEAYGINGLETPVYYSFEYPDAFDIGECVRILEETVGDELSDEERWDAAADLAAWARATSAGDLRSIDAEERRRTAASPGFGAAVDSKRDRLR